MLYLNETSESGSNFYRSYSIKLIILKNIAGDKCVCVICRYEDNRLLKGVGQGPWCSDGCLPVKSGLEGSSPALTWRCQKHRTSSLERTRPTQLVPKQVV